MNQNVVRSVEDGTGSGTGAGFDVDDFPGGLSSCLEAVLMAADGPRHSDDMARLLGVDASRVADSLHALSAQYDDARSGEGPRGFELLHSARGWQLCSRAVYEPVVSAFVAGGQNARLSQAALEALAIIAYRQPVTRAQVAAVRGVNSDGVVRSLFAHGLVVESGVDPDSRAAVLSTSPLFLEKMGLESLDQLPSLAPFMPVEADVMNEAHEELR